MSERYVDARELAQLMGLSVRTIKRWTAAGMPSEDWGMSRTRRYLPSEAMAWARARTMPDDNHIARLAHQRQSGRTIGGP